jgi:L-alanine-DL-glutamate epimerase-like enolase superfamily enzyme
LALTDELIVRVDANGAFATNEALSKLERLSQFDLHSIEQPIRQGQLDSMCELCKNSPIDIALDEELIGIFNREDKLRILDSIEPQYIILKPSFIGGFRGSDEWIELCEERKIGWWATSALESNIGLNAIAQWTASKEVNMHQGLGTGQLYTNNFPSPLEVQQGQINYRKDLNWDLSQLEL